MRYINVNAGKRILNILFILSILLKVGSPTSVAQEVGIEAGYIGARFKNMQPFVNTNDGFSVGLMYSQRLVKSHSLLNWKTGLAYQMLHGIGEVSYTNLIGQQILTYEKTQELYYLQIPAMLQLRDADGHFFFQGGLYYGYLLKAWHNPQPEGINHDVTSQFNRNMLGYHVGAGISIPVHQVYRLQFLYDYSGNITQVHSSNQGSGFTYHTFQTGFVMPISKFRGTK